MLDKNNVEERLLELKKRYTNIITMNFGGDVIFLTKPNRHIVSMSITKGLSNVLAQAEVIIENCYIDGTVSKEDVFEDIGLLLGINAKMGEILAIKQVEIKNL